MTNIILNIWDSVWVSTHMPLARHDWCISILYVAPCPVSTHMPLARHDQADYRTENTDSVSTHMPLARHDFSFLLLSILICVSTHMPLARHDNMFPAVLLS